MIFLWLILNYLRGLSFPSLVPFPFIAQTVSRLWAYIVLWFFIFITFCSHLAGSKARLERLRSVICEGSIDTGGLVFTRILYAIAICNTFDDHDDQCKYVLILRSLSPPNGVRTPRRPAPLREFVCLHHGTPGSANTTPTNCTAYLLTHRQPTHTHTARRTINDDILTTQRPGINGDWQRQA